MRFKHSTILAIIGIFIFSCSGKKFIDSAPKQLAGIPSVDIFTGPKADNIVSKLHIGKFPLGENLIAYYQQGDSTATLYISRYKDASLADTIVTKMALKIGHEGYGFWHHKEINLDGLMVHFTFGQGQSHFFWKNNKNVIWLAINTGLAFQGLSQLIDIPIDTIQSAFQKATEKRDEI
ncbi:MAG: hypothetical protein Kow00108_05440 [Calditrichia bacterium]